MGFFFFLIGLLPAMVNLAFSVFAHLGFHRYPRPPIWIICFLLILGSGTLRLIFMVGPGFLVTLPSSLSAVLCIVQALALACQRWLGFGVRKSWGFSCLLVIPVVVWMDLRFSVLVVDEDGNSVEVDTKQIQMQASHAGYGSWGYSTFYYGYGNRLKKGVVYFGFCQWVQHRGNWLIWGDAVSPEGKSLRREKISQKANWGNWPLRITVDPETQ
jgi:hypothetical protein